MPSQTRKRRPRSRNQTRKNRKTTKTPVKKGGLTNTEKAEVKKIIANKKEFRYCDKWINYDYFDPSLYSDYQKPYAPSNTILPNVYSAGNGTASIVGFQMGQYANTATTQFDAALVSAGQPACMNQLGGISMTDGTDQTNISGDYALLHSCRCNFQVNTIPASGNADAVKDSVSPMIFRVIHVSAKKDQAGITPSLSGDLFRDMINENQGLMSFMTLKQLMTDYKLNRDRFHVHADFKFKLSEPVEPDYAGNSANQNVLNLPYPTQKNFTLYMPKPKKKLRFSDTDNGLTNAYEWTNSDFVSYCFLISCREQNTSGDYSNTAKRWTVSTMGQTKYRDV